MKLLILLLSFGMATEWGSSLSVRTPNDTEKELDYEFSMKFEDTNDKIRYLLKRDWKENWVKNTSMMQLNFHIK